MSRNEKPAFEIVDVQSEYATLTARLPERAVRALAMFGQFGVDALATAISRHMSETEARKHAAGLADLVVLGQRSRAILERLSDARDVMEGRKVAVVCGDPS